MTMKVFEILDLKRQIEALENEVNETTGEFIDNSEKIKELIDSLGIEKEEKLRCIGNYISYTTMPSEINFEYERRDIL